MFGVLVFFVCLILSMVWLCGSVCLGWFFFSLWCLFVLLKSIQLKKEIKIVSWNASVCRTVNVSSVLLIALVRSLL